ncbi:MAG: diguanylate cyclase [Gammaproteobacteria bacterium]|nr:diguanylate cyclase [Gammaproteobacteria bacterium]
MNDVAAQTDFEAELARERWTLLADNVRSSGLPTALVGAMLAAFYSVAADLHALWAWFVLLAGCVAVRASLVRPVRVAATDGPGAALHAVLGVTGLLWALAPVLVSWWLGPIAAFTAIVLAAGIAIAAFGSYAQSPRAASLVALPIGLAVVGLSATSAVPAYYTIAVALPLLYAHQYVVAAQMRAVLDNQIRLRVENAALAAELGERVDRTAAELDRRMETERVLRASRDRAERLSSTDGLTEIANRRYFDKRLRAEVSRAFRDRSTLSLVIADIDYFKQFNDLYGHQKGDECLQAFARVLESYCRRGGDLAARLGGEEFALLLPTTEQGAAIKLADQARAAFEARGILHAGSKVNDNATASFGVASVTPDTLEAGAALYGAADKALYLAKEHGRNRVVGAGGPGDAASAAS